jgi:hypothetical protein
MHKEETAEKTAEVRKGTDENGPRSGPEIFILMVDFTTYIDIVEPALLRA